MYWKGLLLITIGTIVVADEFDSSRPPQVTLSHGGVLVGSYMKTVNNKEVRAFRGVPYAKPPVGNLRFMPPVEASKWSGKKLANKDANICPQLLANGSVIGSEDCLYLNVYTPKKTKDRAPLAVMYYIHGGGFTYGSGSSNMYNPGRLLDHDVILVTSNYRLGPFGFLSTGTNACPGNNGLKDQALVLEWIKKNIGNFGGNPNAVTIFGQSAGGASVSFHMISPVSKGLFQKAIIQSGNNFNPWAFVNTSVALDRAIKTGEFVNCPTRNLKKLIECLRTKSVNQLISTAPQFIEFDNDPMFVYLPVIESKTKDPFIAKLPHEVPIPDNIPIMIGITTDEGILKSKRYFDSNEFEERFREVLPLVLYYFDQPENVREELTSAIDNFYFNGVHDWSTENWEKLTDMLTDRYSFEGMNEYLRHRFDDSKALASTYVYLFNQKGPKSIIDVNPSDVRFNAVAHEDELPYLFHFPGFDNSPSGTNNAEIQRAMPLMWVNFARTGNPTPSGSGLPTWKRATKFPLKYVRIGTKKPNKLTILSRKTGFWQTRMRFWRDIKAQLGMRY